MFEERVEYGVDLEIIGSIDFVTSPEPPLGRPENCGPLQS